MDLRERRMHLEEAQDEHVKALLYDLYDYQDEMLLRQKYQGAVLRAVVWAFPLFLGAVYFILERFWP